MIACLRGKLLYKLSDTVIIDVGGVGYEVHFPADGRHQLPAEGTELFLHIQTVVREDAFLLYGFVEPEEKAAFLLLTGVSGIGPKVAHAVLSGLSPADLSRAVTGDDIHTLIKLPGVGKKTAERICLELKDKVQFMPSSLEVVSSTSSASVSNDMSSDVVSALVNLGYSQAQAEEALHDVRRQLDPEAFQSMPLEEMLRQALRVLA
ncbi:MAG: Holliday junction branch migration protein RuvA [Desulfobulbaceae bacterium]|nr:Holliday junction branch migration protein RuvA [Desulfobulbaceae bacterium]